MPPDQHVSPAEEPSPASSPGRPEDPAADGTAFMPGVLGDPASRVRIQTQVMRIGRRPDNNIVISDLGVSKQHAELRRSPAGQWSISDLNSHKGTLVNGTWVSQQELKEGDIIAIGRATFRLAGGELIEYVGDGRPVVSKGTMELPRVRQGIEFIQRAEDAGELRITGDDDAALLLWGAAWLDEHREWIIAAMRFVHPAQPGDDGGTATVVIELTSPGTFPPGHPDSKPRLGPWSHGVPPMPV